MRAEQGVSAISPPWSCASACSATSARGSLFIDDRSNISGKLERIADLSAHPSRPEFDRCMRVATSSCRNNTRKDEQRWPALSNAEVTTSRATCSGKAVESTIIALSPPVSAMSAGSAPSRAARARLIRIAVSVEPVNATPISRESVSMVAAMRAPPPGRDRWTLAGHPRLMQQPYCRGTDEGCLFCWLCEDAVARRQSTRHLTAENG